MKRDYLKFCAAGLSALTIINLVLFVLGKVTALIFWSVIIFSALMAYYVIPNLKKKAEEK